MRSESIESTNFSNSGDKESDVVNYGESLALEILNYIRLKNTTGYAHVRVFMKDDVLVGRVENFDCNMLPDPFTRVLAVRTGWSPGGRESGSISQDL